MRNLYSIFLFFVFSCGTDFGEGDTYFYSLSNQSNQPITIYSYRSGFQNTSPIITHIGIGETIERTFKDGLPPTEYNFKVFLAESRLNDSLLIIYANEKKAIFVEECNSNNRNLIDICIYGDLREDFIFTENDFMNAVDCEGPCN